MLAAGQFSTNLDRTSPASGPIETAVARLDAWLETMRGPDGYGGPVAHWWQQSLLYTGVGLDWRYEGIIGGYLALWERNGDQRWLAKAVRAGDDLLTGQIENSHFRASAFEINPASAGTPHEAACDLALLLLAHALRRVGRSDWQRYASAAECNMREFYLAKLWDPQVRAFRDDPRVPSFVPNKAATVCEALFLLAQLCGDDKWIEHYALPTIARILEHQVCGGMLDGAIAQNSSGTQVVEKYFPIYIARCVPALLLACEHTGDEYYADAALRALRFVVRFGYADGSFPTVVYPGMQANRYPAWIAPLGDVLRAVELARPYGFTDDVAVTHERLLEGQDANGGIRTACGFAAQAGGKPSKLPDLRDLLHVVGWCDKAFRYLATRVQSPLPVVGSAIFEAHCEFRGHELQLVETPDLLQATGPGARYHWHKGQPWAEATHTFWLR